MSAVGIRNSTAETFKMKLSLIAKQISTQRAVYVSQLEQAVELADRDCDESELGKFHDLVKLLEEDQQSSELLTGNQQLMLERVLAKRQGLLKQESSIAEVTENYILMENLVYRDADGKIVKQYDKLSFAKNVEKDENSNIMFKTIYDWMRNQNFVKNVYQILTRL